MTALVALLRVGLAAAILGAGPVLGASHHSGDSPPGTRLRANTLMAQEMDAAEVKELEARMARIAQSTDAAERRRLTRRPTAACCSSPIRARATSPARPSA